MRTRKPIVAASAAVLALALSMPVSASATTGDSLGNLEADVATIISAAIESDLAALDDPNISFGTPVVTVSPETAAEYGYDAEAIAGVFFEEVQAASTSTQTSPPVSARATGTYIADQNVTLPSIGVAWIAQKLSYNISGSYINSLSTVGSSYMYGVALGTWTHNNTSLDIRKSRSCVRTTMSGEFHYTVHGVGVHLPANVTGADAASGGGLHSVIVADC